MKTAVSNSVMRACDAETIKSGTPSKALMSRAGEGIYGLYDFTKGKTAIVCGCGNNAGDGYVLAMCIKKGRYTVPPTLILLEEKFSDDGKYYFDMCRKLGVHYELFNAETDFSGYDTIVDCIFGTGFRGKVEEPAAECIRRINAAKDAGKYVISADINSGLSGDSGKSGGICVKSDLTAAIQFYKSGHFLGEAKDVIGRISNIDIGIKLCDKPYFVPEQYDFRDIFKVRPYNSHKGSYGYTAIIGGCSEYSGAAKLANLACSALKSGCGVTKLAVAESVAPSVMPYLLESTLFKFPDKDGHMLFDREKTAQLLKGTSAVSCGMGWGKSGENAKILAEILKTYNGTIIIDADGLNTLAEMNIEILKSSVCKKIILTPHPLEFSRISGLETSEILENPIKCAHGFLKQAGEKVILLLKGTSTVVSDGNETYIVNRGCPGMATAGSGDVLSGILTGIMGYSEPSAKSVACGAFAAGLAGELAEKESGSISMIASDTVRHISDAVKRMSGF